MKNYFDAIFSLWKPHNQFYLEVEDVDDDRFLLNLLNRYFRPEMIMNLYLIFVQQSKKTSKIHATSPNLNQEPIF